MTVTLRLAGWLDRPPARAHDGSGTAGDRAEVDHPANLKTAAGKYSDLQLEASLQLSIYSYATAMNGLADEADLGLRFDGLAKTRQPELHHY